MFTLLKERILTNGIRAVKDRCFFDKAERFPQQNIHMFTWGSGEYKPSNREINIEEHFHTQCDDFKLICPHEYFPSLLGTFCQCGRHT